MLLKRPSHQQTLGSNEERLSETTYNGSHSHVTRHHRKHERADNAPTATSTSASVSSSFGFKTHGSPADHTHEPSLATTKPRKSGRKQKAKDVGSGGLTDLVEAEDEGNQQRRRKTHHRRKNSTLLTNSVHDEVLGVSLDGPSTSAPVGVTSSEHTITTGQV